MEGVVAYGSGEAGRLLARAAQEGGGAVSAQQLARWADNGLLEPSLMRGRRGTSRAYAFSDLVAARTLGLLADDGRISSRRARAVLDALSQAAGQRLDGLALHGDLGGERWIVASDAQRLWPGPAVVLVSLAAVERELREACIREDLPAPSGPPVALPL